MSKAGAAARAVCGWRCWVLSAHHSLGSTGFTLQRQCAEKRPRGGGPKGPSPELTRQGEHQQHIPEQQQDRLYATEQGEIALKPWEWPVKTEPGIGLGVRGDPGATVRARLKAGRDQIIDAIASGVCNTVDRIGVVTRAGANCGSCRGEIERLVLKLGAEQQARVANPS